MEKIILASESPGRIELLSKCFIPFVNINHCFNEDSIKIQNPVSYAKKIAYGKANSISIQDKYKDNYVLGVDTIVVYKNKILGKPKNRIEAEKNIRMLSNKTHKVISGICILNYNKDIKIVKSSISYVKFKKINEDFIKFYLDNNHWVGYAGGYAIQGIFSLVIEKIIGSYTNIVGLPMEILYEMLNKINLNYFN